MDNFKFILFGAAILVATTLSGQLSTDADFKRQVYDRAYTASVIFHSRGYAVNGRYLKFIDGYNMHGLEIDLVKLRHPKEVITSNETQNNARGFVLGRTNSFYTVRAGYVHKSIMFDKTDKGSVSISWLASGGLSLGLLKPIYLQVVSTSADGNNAIFETIRYTGETTPAEIIGEANYFVGIDNIRFQPGIYLKAGFDFDYQLLDKKITSMEAGVIYDYFFKEVPIFYEADGDINWSGFFQLYLAVNFGYKKN